MLSIAYTIQKSCISYYTFNIVNFTFEVLKCLKELLRGVFKALYGTSTIADVKMRNQKGMEPVKMERRLYNDDKRA